MAARARRVDVEHERRCLGHIDGDELHFGFHQAGNEVDVASEAVELRNHQRGLAALRCGECPGQFGPVAFLARLDLGELGRQLPCATVEIVDHGLALSVEAEAALTLLVGADPVVGDEVAVAEQEARAISARTKAGLAIAKARGVKLGKTGAEILAPKYRAEAQARAEQLAPVIRQLKQDGFSMRGIAAELDRRKVETPRGGAWHPQLVSRIVARLGIA